MKVKDTRTFKHNGFDAYVRSRSDSEMSYKTIELPIMAFTDLGLRVKVLDGEVIIEKRDCQHHNTVEVGQFMLTGYDCEDCGERTYK